MQTGVWSRSQVADLLDFKLFNCSLLRFLCDSLSRIPIEFKPLSLCNRFPCISLGRFSFTLTSEEAHHFLHHPHRALCACL